MASAQYLSPKYCVCYFVVLSHDRNDKTYTSILLLRGVHNCTISTNTDPQADDDDMDELIAPRGDDRRFLLEPEAAEIMRVSPGAIKRWRLAGELPYLPGRPVLIERADLEALIQRRKDQAAAAQEKLRRDSRPFSEKSEAEQNAEARAWALRMKAKPPRARRRQTV